MRQRLLAQRRALSAFQVQELGIAAQSHLLRLPQFRDATSIALYAPIHGEVGTSLLHEQASMLGKTILYPAVTGHDLVFRQVSALAMMAPGEYGILEPPPTAEAWAPANIDLIVVPGVAFDRRGYRIGYGKGYYDRTLHPLEGHGRLFGLCYEFQLLDEIAVIPHDVRMDGIVTEHRVICPCD